MTPRPCPGGPRGPVRPAAGVTVAELVAPTPLWASNGIALGPDERLWIAQFLGGTIGALDLATGGLETVLGPDGPLVAPDDLAFDHRSGALYVVDLPPGLVWRRDPDGRTTVVADGITAPDGIAVHEGRLFVNELHPDGRLLEIDLDGGPVRTMATGLVLGNAMTVAPDGLLYFPHLAGGEVWRVALDGGAPERVLADLPMPVAVRTDAAGRLLVLSHTEPQVLVHDVATGRGHLIGTGVHGADNLAVAPDGTLLVSGARHGGIVALHPDGRRSTVLPEGLAGPFGLAVAPDGGLVAADHHTLVAIGADGALTPVGTPGATVPPGLRGVTSRGGELHVITEHGELHAGDPARGMRRRLDGLRAPHGLVAVDDGLLVAEGGRARVLHVDDEDRVRVVAGPDAGLAHPADVAVDDAGHAYASDVARGQVVRLGDGAVLAAGLARPEGLAAHAGALWCLEAGAGRLLRIDPRRRTADVAVDGLALAVAPAFAAPHLATNDLARRPVPFAGLTVHEGALVAGLSGHGALLRIGVGTG